MGRDGQGRAGTDRDWPGGAKTDRDWPGRAGTGSSKDELAELLAGQDIGRPSYQPAKLLASRKSQSA